jgi:lipoprotein-anchoring transpeptidase ErfK/SrfK
MELQMTDRKRHAQRSGKSGRLRAFIVGGVFAVLVLGGAGVAYATADLSEDYEGRILPGSTIAGTEVAGLTREEALEAVGEAIESELHRQIDLTWEDRSWSATPEELGARSNAEAVVDAAFAASSDTSFFEKVGMRFFDQGVGFENDVAIRYSKKGALGFVEGIAESIDAEPRDATIDYSTGWVDIKRERRGIQVQVQRAHRGLMRALRAGDDAVALPVKTIEPEVRREDFDQVLLTRIGENKLYLYEDGKIVREWTVATGLPEYMTPTGLFEVTELRYEPTWINPSPDGWGKDMPEMIPPGPNNPLGVRAINWSAPAIRFHGTSATYSLGYNASHGCVRMANEDVIELYDLVEVGTPIVSVIAGPLKPMYPPPETESEPMAENSADAAGGEARSGDNERAAND